MSEEQRNRKREVDRSREGELKNTAKDDKRQRKKRLQRRRTERWRRRFGAKIDINESDDGYWNSGQMNVECSKCGALQYAAERVNHEFRAYQKFPDCCNNE